jgi:hypothetical protein
VLHSSGQLFSHKRKHERKESELAYRKYKLSQAQPSSSFLHLSGRWDSSYFMSLFRMKTHVILQETTYLLEVDIDTVTAIEIGRFFVW